MRGISSDQRWVVLLILGWVSVNVLGILEVALPYAAEWNFVAVMVFLLHIKYSSAFVKFFNTIGRFDFKEGDSLSAKALKVIENFGTAFVTLFDEILIRTLELVLSTLIYLNKLFIKSPLLAKSFIGPFAFGFNMLMIFFMSAFFKIGFLSVLGHAAAALVVLGVAAALSYAVLENYWRKPLEAAQKAIGKTEETLEKAKATGDKGKIAAQEKNLFWAQRDHSLIRDKMKQLVWRVPLVLLISSGIALVGIGGGSALASLIPFTLAAALLVMNFKQINRLAVIGATGLDGKIDEARKAKIRIEEKFSALSAIAIYVPFALSLLVVTVLPVLGIFADWDFVLRAAPLALSFATGPLASYLASFRFFSDTDIPNPKTGVSDNQRNTRYVRNLARALGLLMLIGGYFLMSSPLAPYLRFLPIASGGPGGDGNIAVYSSLLKVPEVFTFLHAVITAGTGVVLGAGFLLWSWRNVRGSLYIGAAIAAGGVVLSLFIPPVWALALASPALVFFLGSFLGRRIPLAQPGEERKESWLA